MSQEPAPPHDPSQAHAPPDDRVFNAILGLAIVLLLAAGMYSAAIAPKNEAAEGQEHAGEGAAGHGGAEPGHAKEGPETDEHHPAAAQPKASEGEHAAPAGEHEETHEKK